MRFFINYPLLWVIGVMACVSDLSGQSLFMRLDTTTLYSSYRYIEDCEMATLRLTDELETRKDAIWYDTMPHSVRENHKIKIATSRRPDTAITAGAVCLKKFDADTAQIWSIGNAHYIIQLLLMAHRDEDAHRFTQRFLDLMRQKPDVKFRDALGMLTGVYGDATPVRLNDAKRYYAEWLDILKGDSLYRTIDAALQMGRMALRAADTATYQETARYAIKINDSTTVEERNESPGSISRLAWLTGLVGSLTIEEAFDSLAISNMAYRMYEANTVQARVYGEKKRLTPSEIVHNKIPDLVGGSYYVSLSESDTGGLTPYTKKGAVPEGVLPVRDRINYIVWLPSRCHSESKPRLIDSPNRYSGRACMILSHTVRRIKELFPDLEITVLSSTYGTVGKLGPLTPTDEADTLAKLFLGFHKIPARLVVEETPVYHVPDPDRRRIDLPTYYAEALGIRRLGAEWEYAFTDKEGIEVKVLVPFDSDLFYRWLDILNKRVSK